MIRWTSKPIRVKDWEGNQYINQYMDVMFFRRYWVGGETFKLHLKGLEEDEPTNRS